MQSIEEQISTVFASYPAAERAGESMSHINSTPRKLSNNDAETRRKLQGGVYYPFYEQNYINILSNFIVYSNLRGVCSSKENVCSGAVGARRYVIASFFS